VTDDSNAEAPEAIESELRTAADAGRWHDVAAKAIASYGEELLAYLAALTRDQTLTDDAFSLALENLWRGLPKFQWRSSLRTWAFRIARNAAFKVIGSPTRRRTEPLDPAIESIAAPIRTRTATFLQTEQKDRLAALRAELSQSDQDLLILRLGRNLAWRDIAQVLADAELADADLTREAARLRKRFMRLKDELRAKLA
jgi:RNA polymerase sigma-70 factor (ECF subfamily)